MVSACQEVSGCVTGPRVCTPQRGSVLRKHMFEGGNKPSEAKLSNVSTRNTVRKSILHTAAASAASPKVYNRSLSGMLPIVARAPGAVCEAHALGQQHARVPLHSFGRRGVTCTLLGADPASIVHLQNSMESIAD